MLRTSDLRVPLLLIGSTLFLPAVARCNPPVTGSGQGPDGTLTTVDSVPEKKTSFSTVIHDIGTRVQTTTDRDAEHFRQSQGGDGSQSGWFNRQVCSGPQAANNPFCANKIHGSGVNVEPNDPNAKKSKRPPPVADANQGPLTGTWTRKPGNEGNSYGQTDAGPTGQPGSYNNTTWTPGKASQYYTNQINNGSATSDDYYGRAHARWSQGDAVGARQDAVQALNMDPSNGSALSLYKLTDRQITDPKLKAVKPDFGLTSAEGAGGSPGGGGGPGAGARAGTSGPAGDEAGGYGAYGGAPGDVAYGRGDPASVARALNAAAGQPPREQSRSLTRAAIAAYRVKDPSAVLALTAQALKLDPANLEAYSVRSMAYLQAKNYAASAAEATKGLAIDPKSRPLLNRRALAYNRMGRYREGLADALSVLRLSARDAMGYYNRSYAEAGLGNGKAAREDLKLAATLEPRFRKPYEAMVRLPDDSMLLDLYDAAAGEDAGAAKEGDPVPVRKPLPLWPFLAAGAALLAFGALRGLAARNRTSVLLRRGTEAEDAAAGAMAAGPAAAPGTGFWSRYELVKELGAGGMGLVYLAKDQRLDRMVAVKKMRDEIRSNRRERERFLKEAQTVAKLRHPGIVEIYSIEEDGDDAYLVFEYVAGKTLYDLIQEKGRLSLREALDLLRGVCYALEYAHGRNVIHRDLKPSNIMVDADGAVKVMDFGIARQVTDALARQSRTNTVIGTPPYMAPEQEQGVVRRESDIYSLGVCLYEALSGELPFGGTPGAALLSKLEGKYIPVRKLVDGLPEGAESLIRRALTPDPEKRIKSAAEFLQELEKAAA